MFVHRHNALSAQVKQLVSHRHATHGGFSADGSHAWLLANGRIHIWRCSEGSYASVTSVSIPRGTPAFVHVLQPEATGALLVTACTTDGVVLAWFNAASANDVPVHAAPHDGSTATSYTIAPLQGREGPGFVGLLALADGTIAMVAAVRGHLLAQPFRAADVAVTSQRGLLNVLTEVFKGNNTAVPAQSWLQALRGPESRNWLDNAIGTIFLRKPRAHASSQTVVDSWIRHDGGSSWVALTLALDSLDCWHVSAQGSDELAARCTWSLDLRLSLSRQENTSEIVPLRLDVRDDALCMLIAAKGRTRSGWAWFLGVAFFAVPSLNAAQRAWSLLPECLFYERTQLQLDDKDVEVGANGVCAWQLAVRPDIAQVVMAQEAATLLFIRAPCSSGDCKQVCLRWNHKGSVETVLTEVPDCASICWNARDATWQVLSPIFGTLQVCDATSGHAAGAAGLSVSLAPLLEAAVAQQLAGDVMPGFASTLAAMGGLSGAQDGRSAVARFSRNIVNRLPKDSGMLERPSVSAALQQKQQQHGALLQCLHVAGLLSFHPPAEADGRPQLSPACTLQLFQHAEHLGAVTALHHELSTVRATAQGDKRVLIAELMEHLCAGIGEAAEAGIAPEEYLFSCPSDSLLPFASKLTAFFSASTAPSPAALTHSLSLLLSLVRGAASTQRALTTQYAREYADARACGSAGWLASDTVLGAAVSGIDAALAQQGSGEQFTRRDTVLGILDLALLSYKRAIDDAYAQNDALRADHLVRTAQQVTERALDAARPTHAQRSDSLESAGEHAAGFGKIGLASEGSLRSRLQALASRPLEPSMPGLPAPRIASCSALLALCREEQRLAHTSACQASLQYSRAPNAQAASYGDRLLARMPDFMAHFDAPTVLKQGCPAFSAEEDALRNRMHQYMLQSPSFCQYALRTFIEKGELAELLQLPGFLHDQLRLVCGQVSQGTMVQWLLANCLGRPSEAREHLIAAVKSNEVGNVALLVGGTGAAAAEPPAQASYAQERAAVLLKATLLLQRKQAVVADPHALTASSTRTWLDEVAQCDEVIATARAEQSTLTAPAQTLTMS